ncbi:MAG: YggS family pyridoxal phosphate-dependent enzyme [Solidesulfovibrio sp.]|uniref:YggS family pyridoxal phosphate-dependent enzyme n=1 Tax=Solidesulfovibrio sp. TaxID=2910990 RepID=UPI002B1F226D|nr:YggS family pyridoxal phosphate-dependent enzyme [Solidesulfovibrio sp.]MEA4855101.1 YggS family pyridoxal phosphate-dependent enzyme [Solidesulfovibrio sp.]
METTAAKRLARVRGRIEAACAACGRDPAAVTLVAVSKLHDAAAVAALAACGQAIFGESYIQEALPKMEAAPAGLTWHFIGHLQRNKARFAVGRFALLHTLDNVELARVLQKRNSEAGLRQAVCLQVNVAGEAQKSGVSPEGLAELAEAVAAMPALALEGLMVIPPVFDDPEGARPAFARLRALRDTLAARLGLPLPVLSMGMSGDLEAAIGEGATHVRVGTDLFGPRYCAAR